jgi:Xaa-Pro aminopeptidase
MTEESRPLDAQLDAAGCRALLVVGHARDSAIASFAGQARLGDCFVLVPRGAAPRLGYLTPMEREEAAATGLELLTPEALDLPRWLRDGGPADEVWANLLGRAFQLCGLPPSQIAIAGLAPAGRIYAMCRRLEKDGFSFATGELIAARLRRRKNARQLAAQKRAAEGTCEAFRQIARLLAQAEPGPDGELDVAGEKLTIGRLKSLAFRVFAEHRLEPAEGLIVAPGEEGAVPHSSGTDERVLRAGESLVVDLFPRGELYADCTRTFCVGEPNENLVRGHREVLAALELAHSLARPGVRAWEIQEAVCHQLGEAGWPSQITHPGTTRGYVHNLGHGIGYELHDLPSFREKAPIEDGYLEVGDVVTLEPGLYEPEGAWAVRLEDLVIVGENSLENLTPLPYDLDPRAW